MGGAMPTTPSTDKEQVVPPPITAIEIQTFVKTWKQGVGKLAQVISQMLLFLVQNLTSHHSKLAMESI